MSYLRLRAQQSGALYQKASNSAFERDCPEVRIPRHSATQSTNILPPAP